MYAVGTYKQQQYDQGVQKVQAYIDNIAGLDVMKGSHKQYLQSKLNELGGKLKTVAAGDFSNQQLVGSVGGMATQIVKDPIIQNAVYSTQVYRKQEGVRETLAKEGKTSPENDDWWNGQVNDFLSNPDLKTPFNGEYVAYRDLDKKLREIGDKVKEVTKSVDIPYIRDDAGNVVYFEIDPKTGTFKRDGNQQLIPTTREKGGREYVDKAMLRVKIKGTPAQKILDNFYDSLDEGDKKQLLITANYHYKNETPQSFKEDIVYSFGKNREMLENQLVAWEVDLKKANLTDDQREQIEKQIANTKDTLAEGGELDKQMAARLAEIDATPNSKELKYKIYTQKYLTNKAEHMSNQSYEQEIVNNPYMATDIEFMKMEQAAARLRQDHAEFMSNYYQEERKERTRKLERAQDKAEKEAEKAEANAGKVPVVLPSDIPTKIPEYTVDNLSKDTDKLREERYKTIANYGQALFPGLSVKGQRKALTQLMSKYRTNPGSITDPDEMNYIKDMLQHEEAITVNDKRFATVKQSSKALDVAMDKQLATQTGLKLGNTFISAKELVQLNKSLEKFKKEDPYMGGEAPMVLDVTAALPAFAKTKYAPIVAAMAKQERGEPLSANDKILLGKFQSVNAFHNKVNREVETKKYEVEQETLNKIMPNKQPWQATLSSNNTFDVDRTNQLIGRKLQEFKDRGTLEGLKAGETFDGATLSALMKSGKYERILKRNPDGSGSMTLTDGALTVTMPLNATEYSGYYTKYSGSTPMVKYVDMIDASKNLTTNVLDIKSKSTGAVSAGISATASNSCGAQRSYTNYDRDNANVCKICYTNPVNMIFGQCSHAGTCTSCVEMDINTKHQSGELYKCPYCRTNVESWIKIDPVIDVVCQGVISSTTPTNLTPTISGTANLTPTISGPTNLTITTRCSSLVKYYCDNKHPMNCKTCIKKVVNPENPKEYFCKICDSYRPVMKVRFM
jgi:hypothetical protein